MSKVYLLSHGIYDVEYGVTFVPSGRSIAFYCDEGQGTAAAIALAAVYGGVAPRQVFAGGQAVPNYQLPAFNDTDYEDDYRRVHAIRQQGTLHFVGIDMSSPAWLCSTPTTCEQVRAELAAVNLPLHHDSDCAGVFNMVSEAEILSVACRVQAGTPAEDVDYNWELNGDNDEFMIELITEAQRILTWAQTDPDAAMAYFVELPETSRIMLMTREPLKEWVHSLDKLHL
jgi:hypothetical protein